MINIEKGKWYLQLDTQGYVVDCIRYNPQIEGYILHESPSVPSDILNSCYKIENNKIILDEKKLEIVKEQDELRRKEIEEQQAEIMSHDSAKLEDDTIEAEDEEK
jgi:uncharacterized protein YpbB